MKIIHAYAEPKSISKAIEDIPSGTVFTGKIGASEGPWYATDSAIVNLRQFGLSFTHGRPIGNHVEDYNVREAELILR